MTTYKIKQSSPWLFIATFLIVLFLAMFVLIMLSKNHILPKGQPLLFLLCFAPFAGIGFYLQKFTATADTEIILDNVGLKVKWLRQFILHNKPDLEFSWTEIEDYVFQPDRQFDQFKLHLKDGTKFKFYHDNGHDDKDDFRKFLNGFTQKVEQLNNADNNKKNDIKLGKTIYETTWGLALAIFGVVIIVGFPILLLLVPHKGTSNFGNYAMLGASYIGTIYFVAQVYIHRKRRKEHEDTFK